MKRRSKGDVQWTLPSRKRPIAYSTKAVSDLIVVLSQRYETIQDVYDNIVYDYDAKRILKIYIDCGYGTVRARDYFN
jgi:hypothetical protein